MSDDYYMPNSYKLILCIDSATALHDASARVWRWERRDGTAKSKQNFSIRSDCVADAWQDFGKRPVHFKGCGNV